MFSIGGKIVAPGVHARIETAARRIFPLGLRGEALARPRGELVRVLPGDVDDRVVEAVGDV